MEYSPLSKELTSKLSKAEKQNQGIYFTPPSCVAKNLALLQPYFATGTIKEVLEPACGSGEYLTALRTAYPDLKLTGIEYNATIYQAIATHFAGTAVTLLHENYLDYQPAPAPEPAVKQAPAKMFDLIIGNPPYYVMKKPEVPKDYHAYFDGRPNIFLLFLIKSLHLLHTGGILSFVLPKNFLNCLYYDKTRAYLNKQCKILAIEECSADKYIETQQGTIILILQKLAPKIKLKIKTAAQAKIYEAAMLTYKNKQINSPYILTRQAFTIFATPANNLIFKALYQNSKSLNELGFKVSVGTVVWNQCRELLTADETQTRLIYSSSIENNSLVQKTYNDEEKLNYIQQPGLRQPTLIVNRGYGVGAYKFNYCFLDGTLPYLVENHLICITHAQPAPLAAAAIAYKKIIASFADPRTTAFIQAYFGNSAINTTELGSILPIYQDLPSYQDI
jgi:tRNA1(Val) A37 N6-methylase TrmN6